MQESVNGIPFDESFPISCHLFTHCFPSSLCPRDGGIIVVCAIFGATLSVPLCQQFMPFGGVNSFSLSFSSSGGNCGIDDSAIKVKRVLSMNLVLLSMSASVVAGKQLTQCEQVLVAGVFNNVFQKQWQRTHVVAPKLLCQWTIDS